MVVLLILAHTSEAGAQTRGEQDARIITNADSLPPATGTILGANTVSTPSDKEGSGTDKRGKGAEGNAVAAPVKVTKTTRVLWGLYSRTRTWVEDSEYPIAGNGEDDYGFGEKVGFIIGFGGSNALDDAWELPTIDAVDNYVHIDKA
jgi:hypothetical protein